MCYIVFISHGFHWRSIKVASFEYVITKNRHPNRDILLLQVEGPFGKTELEIFKPKNT